MIDRRAFLLASGAIAGLATLPSRAALAKRARVRVVGLKVDYLESPLGLENSRPRFSWRLESEARNVRQSAYRIVVASSKKGLLARRGDLWDSGKIKSKKSLCIHYEGRPLTSRQRCWWTVQVWDERDISDSCSEMSYWEMGLLDPKDWTAQWLAVEDHVARADREAGLHWIWGSKSTDERSRKFRFTFSLPAASKSGQLLAVSSEMTKMVGIWVDGVALGATDAPGTWLTLPPLGEGPHTLALEVKAPAIPDVTVRARGATSFMRFELQNEGTFRVSSVSGWKTSLDAASNWYGPDYDDRAWAVAESAASDYQPWPATPALQLRRTFHLEKTIIQARLYATALGAYEARLNGQRVGNALLTPEPAQYAERVLYRVYDVTPLVVKGENALGLIVGDGWYASYESDTGRFPWAPPPRRVLAQVEIVFADGTQELVTTGPGWRVAESPIRSSEILIGEVYDARLEQPGWDQAGFDDSSWSSAEIAEKPSCRLTAEISPPIRATRILKPCSISTPQAGVHRIDFGQNFAGWCRLRARGPRDTRVELKFAELPEEFGSTDWLSMGNPKRDVFILSGEVDGEIFEPHFTYRGFRYVEVTGLSAPPTEADVQGIVVHSDLAETGRFITNVPLIEHIWRNTLWSQRSNFVGIPTDCPSREQRGYLGDAAAFWDAAAFNMDICAFTARQMTNAVDNQRADGSFPIAAPEPRDGFFFSSEDGSTPGWADGGIIMPWTVWRRYGDLSVIERNWEAMNRYVNSIVDYNPDGLWRHKRGRDLGDWFTPGQVGTNPNDTTPRELIGTAYWAHSAHLLAQMSDAIGRAADAARLRALSVRVRRAFNQTFVKPDGTVANGSQTCYVLALKFDLLPDKLRVLAAGRLAEDVRNRGVALTTGFLGTPFILDVLTDAGYADLAYGLLLRTEYPSWGYMIAQGASTMLETWSGELELEDHSVHTMSQNHYGLGAVCGFLFRRVAGIDAAAPGFETITIHPALDARIKYAGAIYDSVMGRISTSCSQTSEGCFTLKVTIPANVAARIHLPASANARIQESRRDVSTLTDLRLIERSHKEVLLEVGSGSYEFVVSEYR